MLWLIGGGNKMSRLVKLDENGELECFTMGKDREMNPCGCGGNVFTE